MMNEIELNNEIILNSVPPFQPYFLICKSCFWCATCVSSFYKIEECPSCNKDATTESIPLSSYEAYSFNYDNHRGVTLNFFQMNKGSKFSTK